MEISYSELRCKEVVNLNSGVKMGKIIDMIIDANGKNVLGVVVPGVRKIFHTNEDIFIPWRNIIKIGTDVILVKIDLGNVTSVTKSKEMNLGDISSTDEDYLQ